MDKYYLTEKLKELNIYNDFYYRQELKPMAQLMDASENLLCLFTGVYKKDRMMVSMTDKRVIIVFTPTLGGTNVQIIEKTAITGSETKGNLIFADLTIRTKEEEFVFHNVKKKCVPLFDNAIKALMS